VLKGIKLFLLSGNLSMVKSFSYQICVDNFEVVVNQKPIRHVYLRVDSQAGPVKVSAPINFDKELIRRFVVKKRMWILEQQKKYSRQEKDLGYQYVSGEYHYVDGLSVQLVIIGIEGRPFIKLLDPPLLEMHVNLTMSQKQKRNLLGQWYRERLTAQIPKLIYKWEPIMGVKVSEWRIRKMKTRWGSCNFQRKRIWLNLELARWPLACLEYVVVHEMTHLIEPTHNQRFWGILDKVMPEWKTIDKRLNQPLQ